MSALWSQLLSLVAAPPGNAVFHLVLVFSVASALQASVMQWRSSGFPQARRAATGLGVILIAQAFVFAVGFLVALGLGNSAAILPPFDRAITLLSVIWITWLWAFPEPANLPDVGVWAATFVVAASLGLSLISWSSHAQEATFNQSLEDRLWQINSVFFIGIGLALLYLRRPNGYWSGATLLGLALIGHLGHLIIGEPGNYSGFLRLAYLAAFPILLMIPHRFALTTLAVPKTESDGQVPRTKERRRHSTDSKTLQAFLDLAGCEATRLEHAIARAIGHAMLADLCFLLSLGEPGDQSLRAVGYDLIREDSLQAGYLKRGAIPMIVDAMERGRALRLPSSSTSADLKALSEMLGLEKAGHLLCVPIATADRRPVGAILLISPHSDRAWSADDQRYLSKTTAAVALLLERARTEPDSGSQADRSHAVVADLEARNLALTQQLDALRKETEAGGERSQEVNALMLALEELQRSFEELQQSFGNLETENDQLRAAAAAFAQPTESHLEHELRSALEDNAHLENQLAEANHRTLALELARGARTPIRRSEVVLSVAQELRRTMTSGLGYLDLLLGESVGGLGVLQRKFIERMRASMESMGGLMDEMLRILSAEARPDGPPIPDVDLNAVIDSAMSATSGQVREKNISMHIDIPRSLPAIQVDEEALQQILVHLLKNAGSATPAEGAITLAVQATQDDGKHSILLQVTDSGGGIPPEDLPRLFAAEAGPESPPIRGLGDRGPSLSLAKALAESQHGRLWVDSEPGLGSTFSVLLPAGTRDDVMPEAAGKGQ